MTAPHYPALKLLQLAAQALREGRLSEADTRLQEVLSHQPDNVMALQQLGLLAYQRGQTGKAKQLLERAVAAEPDNAPLLLAYGQMLHETCEPRQALDLFLRCLSISSSEAEVWNAAGICLQEISEPARAIEFYLRAIALQPQFAEAYNNLGVVLTREGDLLGAIEHFRQSLRIDPEGADCHSNLGVALRQCFRYAEARAEFQEALRLRPEHAEHAGALGELLSLVYDPAAEAVLRQALERRPDDPEKHWNLSLELLKKGHYAAAWPEFEWRQQRTDGVKAKRVFDQPLWLGAPGQTLENATILLHAEQGFGDTIQCLRFLPGLIARGAQVRVEVQPELRRLAASFAGRLPAGAVQVFARGEPLPRSDWHAPLMSLPLACGTTLQTILAPVRFTPAWQSTPVLEVPAPATPQDPCPQPELPRQATRPLRIGIAWAGNPHHARDRERSLPLASLAPLFHHPGCTWTSLQTGAAAAELGKTGAAIEQPMPVDFLDTAEIIDRLDLVITADTAVAHLAASQGAPTWILLPFVADWRWLRPPSHPGETEPNPWYPRARIFRQAEMPAGQPQAELWKPVIAAVAAALQALLDSRRSDIT